MNYNFPSCMYEVDSCCSLGSCSFLQQVSSCAADHQVLQRFDTSSISMADAKIAASNKSHSEAERRRRKRINAHLSTLRTLVSNTIKGDKASLLEEVVRSIKELKKSTEELIKGSGSGSGSGSGLGDVDVDVDHGGFNNNFKNIILIPTETDELELCYMSEQDDENDSSGNGNGIIIKASLCCEDRPEIIGDIKRALSSVEAKVVRAEMVTMGGRTKAVLWLQLCEEEKLRRALKIVIDKSMILLPVGSGSGVAAQYSSSLPGPLGYKRPRVYHC